MSWPRSDTEAVLLRALVFGEGMEECDRCGRPFVKACHRHRFCSEECRYEAYMERLRGPRCFS